MLTLEEKATNFETFRHIERVRNLLNTVILDLLQRGEAHDQTKLEPPEVALFTEMTPKLAASTFGSVEYEEFKKKLMPALEHHYARNRHHPEHFRHSIHDMNILDILEMLLDWKAASERHQNGNIRKSLEINANRYDISLDMLKMLENTVEYFGW